MCVFFTHYPKELHFFPLLQQRIKTLCHPMISSLPKPVNRLLSRFYSESWLIVWYPWKQLQGLLLELLKILAHNCTIKMMKNTEQHATQHCCLCYHACKWTDQTYQLPMIGVRVWGVFLNWRKYFGFFYVSCGVNLDTHLREAELTENRLNHLAEGIFSILSIWSSSATKTVTCNMWRSK